MEAKFDIRRGVTCLADTMCSFPSWSSSSTSKSTEESDVARAEDPENTVDDEIDRGGLGEIRARLGWRRIALRKMRWECIVDG